MKKIVRADIALSLFVSGKKIEEIATLLGVAPRTISSYKRNSQNNWDEAKAQQYFSAGVKDKEHLFTDFVAYMYDSIKEIREDDEMSSDKKVTAIVKLGDAFSKMRAVAGSENPKAYTKGIIKATLTNLLGFLKTEGIDHSCLKDIAETILKYQDELADVSF